MNYFINYFLNSFSFRAMFFCIKKDYMLYQIDKTDSYAFLFPCITHSFLTINKLAQR